MEFRKKIIGLGDKITLNCPDYSSIIDISVYKGGYDEYYCEVYYTSPDKSELEDKKIHIVCVSGSSVIDSSKSDKPVILTDGYTFLKSIEIKQNITYKLFFFIQEELSTLESRDRKIEEIIEFPQ